MGNAFACRQPYFTPSPLPLAPAARPPFVQENMAEMNELFALYIKPASMSTGSLGIVFVLVVILALSVFICVSVVQYGNPLSGMFRSWRDMRHPNPSTYFLAVTDHEDGTFSHADGCAGYDMPRFRLRDTVTIPQDVKIEDGGMCLGKGIRVYGDIKTLCHNGFCPRKPALAIIEVEAVGDTIRAHMGETLCRTVRVLRLAHGAYSGKDDRKHREKIIVNNGRVVFISVNGQEKWYNPDGSVYKAVKRA